MNTKFPLLRSGFLGFAMVGMKKPESTFNTFSATLLGKQRLEPDNSNFYHEAIQKLFVQLLKDSQNLILKDIVFQESIIRAAAEAFGTKNFYDWLKLQNDSPSFSPMHQLFLAETLDFLQGNPRRTHVQQWVRLLEFGTIKDHPAVKVSQYYEQINKTIELQLVPANIPHLFVRWMQQDNGLYDFVVSMAVIFGNRRALVE